MTPEPIELDVYAEQDTATGIWTIDIPQQWVIGARHGGSRDEAIAAALNAPNLDGYKVTVHDLAGGDLDYSG